MTIIKIIKSVCKDESQIEWNRFQIYSALIEMLTNKYADFEPTKLHETIVDNQQAGWKEVHLWVELTKVYPKTERID